MLVIGIAGLVTFVFTTVLTIAGVGAAFIIIPVFLWLGIALKQAMSTALLLNSISMAFASITFIRHRLVAFRTSIPIILAAALLSPLGAYSTKFLSREVLLWIFVAFLLFAGSMMLFYQPKSTRCKAFSPGKEVFLAASVGGGAGYLGGLLGVGGGNFIVPVLVWLGYDAKVAAATTAFIVIFSSLAGFLGHTALGNINAPLLIFSALGAIAGALLGAWLMQAKLESAQVKKVVGVVLYIIAAKMLWGLINK